MNILTTECHGSRHVEAEDVRKILLRAQKTLGLAWALICDNPLICESIRGELRDEMQALGVNVGITKQIENRGHKVPPWKD